MRQGGAVPVGVCGMGASRILTAKHLAATTALLCLAACGSPKTDQSAPEKDQPAAAANAAKAASVLDVKFQPGRWETLVKIEKFEMGSVPSAMREAMKSSMSKQETAIYCLTAEEAAKPSTNFFNRNPGSDCKYSKFETGGGKLDAAMTCDGPGGGPNGGHTVLLNGTYSSDSYAMTMAMAGEVGPGMPMQMTMNLSSRRTGECTGDEDK